jgi:hypothetical protein
MSMVASLSDTEAEGINVGFARWISSGKSMEYLAG